MAWNYPPNPPYYEYDYYTAGFPTVVPVGTEVDASSTQSHPHPTPPAGTHSDSRRQYTYSLKIINPKKKSQFLVEKFRRLGTFSSPREVRLSILTECEGLVPDNTEFKRSPTP